MSMMTAVSRDNSPGSARLDPWVVDLHLSGGLDCRGSLISTTWILTAAHCVETTIYNDQMVVLVRRAERAGTNQDHELARVAANGTHLFKHPGYDRGTITNDVALIRLDTAVPLDEFVQPVALPTAGRAVGERGKFVNASATPGLVAIYDGTFDTVSGTEFTFTRTDIAACPGDSGSTFVVNRAGVASAVGIVSSATIEQTCEPGRPQEVTFMDVASYVGWITSITGVPAERAAGNVTVTHRGSTNPDGQLYLRCIGNVPSGDTNGGEMAVPGGRIGIDCPATGRRHWRSAASPPRPTRRSVFWPSRSGAAPRTAVTRRSAHRCNPAGCVLERTRRRQHSTRHHLHHRPTPQHPDHRRHGVDYRGRLVTPGPTSPSRSVRG